MFDWVNSLIASTIFSGFFFCFAVVVVVVVVVVQVLNLLSSLKQYRLN